MSQNHILHLQCWGLLQCFRCHFVDNATQCGGASAPPIHQSSLIKLFLVLTGCPRPLPNNREQAWASLRFYSSSRFKQQTAQPALANDLKVGLDQPTAYREADTSKPLSTQSPVRLAPPAYFRNFVAPVSLRLFGHRSYQSPVQQFPQSTGVRFFVLPFF